MSADVIISDKTGFRLPQVIGIVAVTVAFMGYQYALQASVKDKLGPIEYRLGRIEEILSDRVTQDEFQRFADLLQARNPTLLVPNTRK